MRVASGEVERLVDVGADVAGSGRRRRRRRDVHRVTAGVAQRPAPGPPGGEGMGELGLVGGAGRGAGGVGEAGWGRAGGGAGRGGAGRVWDGAGWDGQGQGGVGQREVGRSGAFSEPASGPSAGEETPV